MNHHDVIVVGLGTAGSATCMTLAQRGVSVLGIDSFHPPHTLGSHHGESRSVRRAYLEGSAYLPMALRAWDLWHRLEKDSGEKLLVTTGNLTVGPPEGPAVSGFLASARAGGITHDLLTAAETRRRWPLLAPPRHFAAGLEKEAGIVFPETCIRVLLAMAESAGARLQVDEQVTGWDSTSRGIEVRTSLGRYTAGRLLIAAGTRAGRLSGTADGLLTPKRVPVHWITPPDATACQLGQFPVNFWQIPLSGAAGTSDEYREFYTLPAIEPGGRVKAAFHNQLTDGDPEQPSPAVSTAEQAAMRAMLQRFLPTLSDRPMTSDTCMYTLTPDDHFVLGPLPQNGNVFAVALAGHGFKFAPVLGEILADLLEGIVPAIDMGFFSPKRFAGPE